MKILNFVYKNKIGKILQPLLRARLTSKVIGFCANLRISRYCINYFIKKNNIDMEESLLSIVKFKSFNDFFIRKLKPTARSIDNISNSLISPADSYLFVVENVSKANSFFVKAQSFTLMRFLNDVDLAREYDGGMVMIFRLTPPDYHRFHFPIECTPSKERKISGIYDSVDPIVYQVGKQPLITNERSLITLNDKILMIAVGAMCVGKIVMTYKPNNLYQKGEEAGYFSFGGSTIVLVLKPNITVISAKVLNNSKNNFETKIKMGEYVGSLIT